MTVTYTPDFTLARDQNRLLIGDTDTTAAQLTDEEIAWLVTQERTTYKAAAACCRAIAGKYARQVDKSVGDLKVSLSQKQKAYRELAAELSLRGGTYAVPTAGGISIADRDAYEADTDLIGPTFKRGQASYPGSGSDSVSRDDTTSDKLN